jgi:hypothetical protein
MWINTFTMSLRLGEDIDATTITFFTLDIGKSSYTWVSWIHSDCSAYYGYLGNSQIQLATLGAV